MAEYNRWATRLTRGSCCLFRFVCPAHFVSRENVMTVTICARLPGVLYCVDIVTSHGKGGCLVLFNFLSRSFFDFYQFLLFYLNLAKNFFSWFFQLHWDWKKRSRGKKISFEHNSIWRLATLVWFFRTKYRRSLWDHHIISTTLRSTYRTN